MDELSQDGSQTFRVQSNMEHLELASRHAQMAVRSCRRTLFTML